MSQGPDIYGAASVDSYYDAPCSDNIIAYRGTFQGLIVGAIYSLGRGAAGIGNLPGQGTCVGEVAGDVNQCRQWSAMLKYDGARDGVATSYDEQRGGVNAAANFYEGVAPFALISSAAKDTRLPFDGYATVGPVKVGSGFLGRSVTTAGALYRSSSNRFP